MRNKIHFFSLSFFMIFFIACTNKFVPGHYTNNPHQFIFYSDSTFTYEYHYWGYKESSGKWKLQNNVIYLNSYNQKDKIPLLFDKIKTSSGMRDIAITINVETDTGSTKDYICTPYINGSPVISYPERGSYCFWSDEPIDNIYLSVWKSPLRFAGTGSRAFIEPVKTEDIVVDLSYGDSLSIDVMIEDSLFIYRVFNNEKLRLGKNKIIFFDKEKDNKKNKLHFRKE